MKISPYWPKCSDPGRTVAIKISPYWPKCSDPELDLPRNCFQTNHSHCFYQPIDQILQRILLECLLDSVLC